MPLYIPFNGQEDDIQYIDVRSESEYESGHIIGAINMPILNDAERHEVGTLYKQVSVIEAKRLGLKVAAGKVLDYFNAIQNIRENHPETKIVFYCARGGFRSRSISQLLHGIGEDVHCLEGGYKHYRKVVLDYLEDVSNFPKFIMLHGYTGAGKTLILHALNQLDHGVLDLEGAANHKGSHLGAIGTDCQQNMQIFQNRLYDQLIHIKTPYAFVESESKRIGSVFIPPILFEAIRSGQHLLIERSIETRAKALTEEYCNAENFSELIRPSFEKIKPYLSNENYATLDEYLISKDYEAFAKKILEVHYDPIYFKSIKNYDYDATIPSEHIEEGRDHILKWIEENQ